MPPSWGDPDIQAHTHPTPHRTHSKHQPCGPSGLFSKEGHQNSQPCGCFETLTSQSGMGAAEALPSHS